MYNKNSALLIIMTIKHTSQNHTYLHFEKTWNSSFSRQVLMRIIKVYSKVKPVSFDTSENSHNMFSSITIIDDISVLFWEHISPYFSWKGKKLLSFNWYVDFLLICLDWIHNSTYKSIDKMFLKKISVLNSLPLHFYQICCFNSVMSQKLCTLMNYEPVIWCKTLFYWEITSIIGIN